MTGMDDNLLIQIDGRGVARLTLNRPKLKNAFDDVLIARLDGALATLATDDTVRVVIITGAGDAFSAGADLGWMRRMADMTEAENEADARALATLMHRLDRFPKPTIAAVNGPAIAGGMGIVACTDIAVGIETASFGLSEVRLGLIPAVISPFVIRAIGPRAARRYFLTAERFAADEAMRLGLLHEVVTAECLEERVEALVADLLAGGPVSLARSKMLVRDVEQAPVDDALLTETARRIAAVRVSPEGREGIGAFLEKRKPSWNPR